MRLDWNHWFYDLGKTVIGGTATAVTAWLSTAIGAVILPQHIEVMRSTSFVAVIVTATATNLFFYLKQSPLPRDLDAAPQEDQKP